MNEIASDKTENFAEHPVRAAPVLTMLSVGDEGEKNIVIMGDSDLRGNIWSFSYEDNAEAANNGLVCAYNYVRQVFNGV